MKERPRFVRIKGDRYERMVRWEEVRMVSMEKVYTRISDW